MDSQWGQRLTIPRGTVERPRTGPGQDRSGPDRMRRGWVAKVDLKRRVARKRELYCSVQYSTVLYSYYCMEVYGRRRTGALGTGCTVNGRVDVNL